MILTQTMMPQYRLSFIVFIAFLVLGIVVSATVPPKLQKSKSDVFQSKNDKNKHDTKKNDNAKRKSQLVRLTPKQENVLAPERRGNQCPVR